MFKGTFFKKVLCSTLIGTLFIQNSYAIIDVNNSFLDKNGRTIQNTNLQEDFDYKISINNSSDLDSTNANFIHRLPEGIKISDNPNIRNTCGDISNVQTENDGETGVIKLVNGTINGTNNGGTCEIKVSVYGNKGGNYTSTFQEGILTVTTGGVQENNVGNSQNSINIGNLNSIETVFLIKKYTEGSGTDDENIYGEFLFNSSPKVNVELNETLRYLIPPTFRLYDDNSIVENQCGVDINISKNDTGRVSHLGFSNVDGKYSDYKGVIINEGYDVAEFSGTIKLKDFKERYCRIKFKLKENFKANSLIDSSGNTHNEIKTLYGLNGITSNFLGKNDSMINTKQGIIRHVGRYDIKYSRGLLIQQIVPNNLINIFEGEGNKEIQFKFTNADLSNKNINFSHIFPSGSNGGEMIFDKVLSNTCGGQITGDGTKTFTITNGNIEGSKKVLDENNFKIGGGNLLISDIFSSCSVKINTKVSNIGQYISIFNYKDIDKIKNKEETLLGDYNNITNYYGNDSEIYGHRIVFNAQDSNGIEANKFIQGKYANSDHKYGPVMLEENNSNLLSSNLQRYANETFYEAYELKNISGKELNLVTIKTQKSSTTTDGRTINFIENGDIISSCQGEIERKGDDGNGSYVNVLSSLGESESCTIKIPIRVQDNSFDNYKMTTSVSKGYIYETPRINREFRVGDISVNGKGNLNKDSRTQLNVIFNPSVRISHRTFDGIFGKESSGTLTLINSSKESDMIFDGQNLLGRLGKNFQLTSHYCNVRGENGQSKRVDSLLKIDSNGRITGTLLKDTDCSLNYKKLNFTKEEFDNLNETDGIIKKVSGDKHSIYVIPFTDIEINFQQFGHKLNNNERLIQRDGFVYDFLMSNYHTNTIALNNAIQETKNQFNLYENNLSGTYSLSFQKDNINGGANNRITLGLGSKIVSIGDLKEELSRYGLLLGTNLGISLMTNGSSYFNGKRNGNELVEGEDYEITQEGDIIFKNIEGRTSETNPTTVSFNITSVKGGVINKSGGGLNYETTTGHIFNEANGSFLIRRNINLMNGFKKGVIEEGETTEFYLDLFNSQLNREEGNLYTKSFPKNLDISLKENQCGGTINLEKLQDGTTKLTMNGQILEPETRCRIIFDVTGKEAGVVSDSISNGTYSTKLGKVNIDSSFVNLTIKRKNGVLIFREKESMDQGEEQNILIRINKSDSNRGIVINGNTFEFELLSGLGNMTFDNLDSNGTKIVNKNNLISRYDKCTIELEQNISIRDGNRIVFYNDGISIPENKSYCDILLKVTGTEVGNGKELKVINYQYEGMNGGGLDSNTVSINVVAKQITVKHIDIDTNQPIYDNETLTSNGTPKTDNVNYEYVRGESSDNRSTYTHYYRKKDGKVLVKYIDVETNNEIKDGVEVLHKWGDNYDIRNKKEEILNYSFVRTEGTENGVVSSNETTIKHFYSKKQGNIIVEYKLVGTDTGIGETSYTETKKWGETYDVRDKKKVNLDNYTYVSTTGTENGTVGANEIKVTHYYTKKVGQVNVRLVDKDLYDVDNNTGDLKNLETLRINYLDTYDVRNKKVEINNYTFDSVVGVEQGVVNKDNNNITVIYKYVKNKGTITVNYYKNGTTEKIKDSYTEIKKYGETYNFSDKKIDIEKYNFVRTEGDNHDGTINKDNYEINHYYDEKNGTLKVKHLDYHTNEEVSNEEVFTKGLTSNDLSYNTSNKTIDGYTFTKIKDGDQENGTFTEGEKIVTYYYTKNNRKDLTVRFVDENGESVKDSIVIPKTREGYIITDKIKNIDRGTGNLKFKNVKKGDVLECNDIDCLNDDSIDLIYERRVITFKVRNYIRNVKDEGTCSVFGMSFFDKQYEDFDKYKEIITSEKGEGTNLEGMFTKPLYLLYGKNIIESEEGYFKFDNELNNFCIDKDEDVRTMTLTYGKENLDQEIKRTTKDNNNLSALIGGIRLFNKDSNYNQHRSNLILETQGISHNEAFKFSDLEKRIFNNNENSEYEFNIELSHSSDRKHNIKFLEEGSDIEIKKSIEENVLVGDKFDFSHLKEQKIGIYEFSGENNVTGYTTIDGIDSTIFYYIKKKGNVTVKYTGDRDEKLADDFTKKFNYGDDFNINTRDFEDYILTSIVKDGETVTDTNGEVSKKDHVVEFKYTKKQGDVIVQYIDNETGDIIKTETEKVRYGDDYAITRKEIPNYTYSNKVEGKENGTITRYNNEEIIKYYVTHNKGSVAVNYIDKETGSIIKTENLNGKVGDKYNVTIGTIENYNYDSNEGELNGEFNGENKEVKLFFVKKTGNVNIKYIDKETGTIIEEKTFNGKIGDKINVEKKSIEGYTFENSNIELSNLTVTNGENVIELFYTRNKGSVTIKYVDENGKEIKESEKIEGKYGDKYEIKFNVPEGYSFINTSGNTVGVIDGDVTISIQFKKNVIKTEDPKPTVVSSSSGPGGYVPTNNTSVNTNVTIINEQKEEVKTPIIILDEPKIIFDPIETEEIIVNENVDNNVTETITIKLPKTGVDLSIENQIKNIIENNGSIRREHKSQISSYLLENMIQNGYEELSGNIEMIINSSSNSTEYHFTMIKREGDNKIETKISIDLPNEDIVVHISQDDIKNLIIIGGIVILTILGISLTFILKRRKKKLEGFDTL